MNGLSRASPADGTQQRDGFGQRVLFAIEAGNESPSTYFTASFERSEGADEIAPREGLFFPDERPAEDDAGTSQQLTGDGFDRMRLHALTEKKAPAPRHGGANVAPRRGNDQRSKTAERVARHDPSRHQLAEAIFELRGKKPGRPGELLRKHGPSRDEDGMDLARRTGQRSKVRRRT